MHGLILLVRDQEIYFHPGNQTISLLLAFSPLHLPKTDFHVRT